MNESHIASRLLIRLRDCDINGWIENGTLVLISSCGEFQTDVNIDNLVVPDDKQLQADLIYYHTRRLLRAYRHRISYGKPQR